MKPLGPPRVERASRRAERRGTGVQRAGRTARVEGWPPSSLEWRGGVTLVTVEMSFWVRPKARRPTTMSGASIAFWRAFSSEVAICCSGSATAYTSAFTAYCTSWVVPVKRPFGAGRGALSSSSQSSVIWRFSPLAAITFLGQQQAIIDPETAEPACQAARRKWSTAMGLSRVTLCNHALSHETHSATVGPSPGSTESRMRRDDETVGVEDRRSAQSR